IAAATPPDARGTAYCLGNLANGVGRAAGNALVGAAFPALARALPPPLNFAAGLALFQAFFVPTGVMYYLASRTAPRDIDAVRRLLRERAHADAPDAHGGGTGHDGSERVGV